MCCLCSTLVNLYLFDTQPPVAMPTRSPHRSSLLAHVLPLLQPLLLDTQAAPTANGQPIRDDEPVISPLLVTVDMGRVDDAVAIDAVTDEVVAMDTGTAGGEDDERKSKISLCKTGQL